VTLLRAVCSSSDWGTGEKNVSSWVYTRKGRPEFLLLRYEDMLADAERELSKVARFLGIEIASERLTAAVERSSADRMRSLEATQGDQWVSTKNKRSDIPFVRTASSGLWKENCRSLRLWNRSGLGPRDARPGLSIDNHPR